MAQKLIDIQEYLKERPIELSMPPKESKALRKLLKEANRDMVLYHEEEKGVKSVFGQYTNFRIYCDRTTFAQTYFRFGIMYAEKILPIWQARFNKKNS